MENENTEPAGESPFRPQSREEYIDDNAEKQKQTIAKWAAIEKEWLNDLRSNPRYRNYFDKYDPGSVKSFIESYVTRKMFWLRYGSYDKNIIEDRESKFRQEAYSLLWEIQQKKLFNLQCEWRAEKIKLPGVELCTDFLFWEHDISRCPFLSPVSSEDVALYREYILSNDYCEMYWMDDWQDYETFKNEYLGIEDGDYIPEWYSYYDLRRGTGMLLSYPDIRGEKEMRYMEIARESERKKEDKENESMHEVKPEHGKNPKLEYYPYYESFREFVELFEDKKTRELFHAFETEHERQAEGLDFELDSVLHELNQIAEKVPVQENADWRQGLYNALQIYRWQKLADALPHAFEDYLMRLNAGISHPGTEDSVETYTFFREYDKKMIIKGRILMGEPPDLNF